MPEILSNNGESEEKSKREAGTLRVVGVSIEAEKAIFESMNIPFDLPEREKTPQEAEIVRGILDKMPEFIRKYRGTPIKVEPGQIHFLDKEKARQELQRRGWKVSEAGAFYRGDNQSISVFASDNDLVTAQYIAHEVLHFNSFESIEVKEKEVKNGIANTILGTRRLGFQVQGKRHKAILFDDINEAITEELAKRFDNEYFQSIPELSEKVEQRKQYIDILLKQHPAHEEQIRDTAKISLNETGSGDVKVDIKTYNYPKERAMLNSLIQEIYEKNRQDFKSQEEVFNVFMGAYMSGKLLDVARLVEKTYGKGSFRKLGEQTKKK